MATPRNPLKTDPPVTDPQAGDLPAADSTAGDLPFATTLHVRDNCVCLHLQRAARALARRYDDALRPVGLTNGQFSLLMSLNRPAPPLMGEVASLLAMDRTTLTAALKPLERRGLLTVAADEQDRRGRRLTLTAAGRDLLVQAMPIWERTQVALEKRLAGSDIQTLLASLRALS